MYKKIARQIKPAGPFGKRVYFINISLEEYS